MKVAITASGNELASKIDQRFGRCQYFALYDTATEKTEFVENSAKDAPEGAGPAAVAIVANRGAMKVVSGEFGFKIKTMLTDLGIQMVIMKEEKTVAEIIELLNK